MRRPPLAEYEELKAEIDRKAVGHVNPVNPGSAILHCLNRAEYANAIRDLLDLKIDPATFLPPDDSARGFDNIAGSLALSPTLLEASMPGRPESLEWGWVTGRRPGRRPT
jgi:hypothetical protein